jgi:DNA-binding NarL/FixJ family response regulator
VTSADDLSPRSVLLVDDTPEIRMLVRRALERGGALQVVAEAGDGAAGLDAARAHHPDLVLLDIAMPVMDGLEALPLIRELLPDATVIMLSGFGAELLVEKAMASGADGYIQKGQPMRELIGRVHQLLDTTPTS